MATRGLAHFRIVSSAIKASRAGKTDIVLKMLDQGMREGWSDKTLGMIITQLRPHMDEGIAQHLGGTVEAGCGPFARRAVAMVLGSAGTPSGRQTLRRLTEDPDKHVASHAVMSLEGLRGR